MSDSFTAIISLNQDFPDRIKKADELVNWLVSKDIIKNEKSNCVLSTKNFGYPPSDGANLVCSDVSFSLNVNGLEIITEEQNFDYCGWYDDDPPVSNLGFIFWNWMELNDEFKNDFKKILGGDIRVIECNL